MLRKIVNKIQNCGHDVENEIYTSRTQTTFAGVRMCVRMIVGAREKRKEQTNKRNKTSKKEVYEKIKTEKPERNICNAERDKCRKKGIWPNRKAIQIDYNLFEFHTVCVVENDDIRISSLPNVNKFRPL